MTASSPTWFRFFVLWIALVVMLGDVHAATTPADRETARSFMAKGRARRSKGDLEGALEAFRAADALVDAPTIELEVGLTLERLGRLVEAKDALMRVIRFPEEKGEPRAFTQARKKAEEAIHALDPRIPEVTFELRGLPPDRTPQLRVDDIRVPPETVALPRKLDPGVHRVAATVDVERRSVEFELAERETKTVVLDFTGARFSSRAPQRKKPVAPQPEEPSIPTLAYIGLGVGAAGVAVGSVAGVLALSHESDAASACEDNRCPPSVHGDVDAAKSAATVSTVAFVIGGIGTAVGLSAILVSGKHSDEKVAVTVRAHLAPFGAGLQGTF